jgi:hypothetical protein
MARGGSNNNRFSVFSNGRTPIYNRANSRSNNNRTNSRQDSSSSPIQGHFIGSGLSATTK